MSSFGEVQLGYSRAVSDDEDDEYSLSQEDENLKRKIHWLTDDYQENKLKVDELILADGPIACAFLHTYLLNHLNETDLILLGLTSTNSEYKVYQTNQSDQQQSINKMRNNFIYQITNLDGRSFLICAIFNQLKSNELYDWIDQLWTRVEFGKSFILCSENKSHYFGQNSETFPCVKFISSDLSLNKIESSCKSLDEPNFMQNLPAAVIHFSMLKQIPFTAFVCYSGSLNVDLQSVKATFNGVSALLKDNSIFTDNDLSKKTLLSIGNIVNSVSTLYM